MRKALATKPKTQTRASSGMPFAGGRSPIPLYHRIYMILREGILNGTYQVGEILPSEAELMSRFTVSRITARRALDELSDEGVVARTRGRGTQVSPRAITNFGGAPIVAGIEGLMANLSIIGRQTNVQVFEFGYVEAPDLVSNEMGVAPREIVQRAVRVRSLDGEPFSLSTTYVLEFDRPDFRSVGTRGRPDDRSHRTFWHHNRLCEPKHLGHDCRRCLGSNGSVSSLARPFLSCAAFSTITAIGRSISSTCFIGPTASSTE